MPTNHYEATARARKCTELYLTCRARHITAEQVATDPGTRSMLVTCTGVREPSDLTWTMVVQTLAMAEQFDATTNAGSVA